MPKHAGKVIPRDYPPENVVYDQSGEYAFLINDEGDALAMAVGTIAYVEPPPDVPATGATAGAPGTWTPPDHTSVPADAASAGSVAASPATAWTVGQYMQGSTAGTAGEMYWNGTAWAAGKAPLVE